ncbi:MAG: hypothetical protein IJW65_00865 [Clostridia bacterium]|nr:hypothetical protein [Clostridia bacterium]
MKRSGIAFKTAIVALATLCAVAFVMFSFAQIMDFDHDCYLESCPVCTAAAVRENILGTWAFLAILLFTFALSVCFYSVSSNDKKAQIATETPVRLKVKLSD